MAKTLSSVNTAADTFGVWANKLNLVVNAIATEVVTVNANANGALTSGNGYVDNIFSSLVFAANTLRGGNVQTTATLTVSSNVNIATGNTLSVGNSTTNASLTEALLRLSNSTVNVALTKTSLGTTTATQFNIIANNVNVVSFFSNGNIGIGNAAATDKFRVEGTFSVLTSLSISNSTIVGFVANTTVVKIANTTSNLTIRIPSAAEVAANNSFLHANGSYVAANPGLGSPGGSNTFLQFNDTGVFGGSNGLFFNKTSNNLSVGNNITASSIFLDQNFIDTFSFVTTGTSAQTVDTFQITDFRTIEYTLSILDNSANNKQSNKVLLLNDGSTSPILSEYAVLISNTNLGVFTALANSSVVSLRFTPTVANTTVNGHKLCMRT